MYTPGAFAADDAGFVDALLARDAFVTLVTVADGAPCVSHLPVHATRDGDVLVLHGHWARANTQAGHDGQALAIVHGPHAYVSPGWYPDKHAAARVPTWNFAVAHLHGTLERFDDLPALADLVDALSRVHEARVGGGWALERDRDDVMRQLRGIVGFRLRVQRIEGKAKLSQNHPEANRAAVRDALERGDAAGREVAAMMRALDNPVP